MQFELPAGPAILGDSAGILDFAKAVPDRVQVSRDLVVQLFRVRVTESGPPWRNNPDTGNAPCIWALESAFSMRMHLDLVQLRRRAEEKADENRKFRGFLKGRCDLEPDEIDRRVFETTRRVWAGIDCTSCANCCRQVKPSFSEEEVSRLARRLGMERPQFIDKYLERTEAGSENPWQTRTKPCPFLEDNRCTVYEDRPADCSRYPYLYEPGFVFRTMAMMERTPTCPIVYEVMERLKNSLGFRRRRRC